MATAPIRIVKAKWFREWFVEQDGGPYICSLVEEERDKAYTVRSRGGGGWSLTATAVGRSYLATRSDGEMTADIDCNPGKLTLHSSGRSGALRHSGIGRSHTVVNLADKLYSYEVGWRDSDATRRICYHISTFGLIPIEFQDLALVMPLFWTGMNLHESPDAI